MTMVSAALQRMFVLLAKFRKCGWNGATCSSEETGGGETALLLELQQGSVPRQCKLIRHLTFSISPPRHMHTHVHI